MSRKQQKKWTKKSLVEEINEGQSFVTIYFTKLDGTYRRMSVDNVDENLGDTNHITVHERNGDWKTILIDRIDDVSAIVAGNA
jgi:hypothetical protein